MSGKLDTLTQVTTQLCQGLWKTFSLLSYRTHSIIMGELDARSDCH